MNKRSIVLSIVFVLCIDFCKEKKVGLKQIPRLFFSVVIGADAHLLFKDTAEI